MSLFRRFRRDKEEEVGTEEPAVTEPSPAAREPTEAVPAPVAPSPTPDAAGPSRIPPPLPDRPAEPAASTASSSDALSKCFVCGTPLEGHTCPTCRMTWVE